VSKKIIELIMIIIIMTDNSMVKPCRTC